MKKKFLAAALIAVLAFNVAACGDSKKAGIKEGTIVSTDTLLSAYNFDVDDYVELGDYKNIEVELDESAYVVNDEAVMSYINAYINDNGGETYETLNKDVVENGDIANIDYIGTIGGKKFDGGSDTGMHLEIGSGSFIEGFEEGLVGHKVGEIVKLKLKFPDDYWNEEYAGKKVTFKATINSIEKKIEKDFDSLTDEDVSEDYNYKNKDEMYESLKSSLESAYTQQHAADIQSKVIEYVTSISTAEVPEDFLKSEIEDTVELAKSYSKEQMGIGFDEYLKQYEKVETEDEYKEKISGELEESLKQQLIIDAIVKAEKWEITKEGYEEFLAGWLESYGMEEEEFYAQYGGKERVMLVYAENTMIDHLAERAKIIESKTDDIESEKSSAE